MKDNGKIRGTEEIRHTVDMRHIYVIIREKAVIRERGKDAIISTEEMKQTGKI